METAIDLMIFAGQSAAASQVRLISELSPHGHRIKGLHRKHVI